MCDHEFPPQDGVVLFSKPPRAGKVKTRLIGELSAEQAAELHAAFLADTAERLSRGAFDLHVAWALDLAEDPADLGGELPVAPASGFRQRGDDLGARLFHGLHRAAKRHRRVAAVGSDSPELDAGAVEDAFGRLAGVDVVVGPTRDGGYYLIGLRRAAVRRELFDGVAWSTESVLADTLARCRRLGLAVELLDEVEDIDVAEDLQLLARRLSARPATTRDGPPQRTAALLAAWGRMPERGGASEPQARTRSTGPREGSR